MKFYFKCLAMALACYGIAYLINTSFGAYHWTASGHSRKALGIPTLISSLDTSTWFPAIGYFERYLALNGETTTRGNLIGYTFAPLILLDRVFFHPSRRIIDERGFPLEKEVIVSY